ncbi:cAMP-binding domain of CRP or a regulatory subunit of cAMP-dependent protein kinases [Chryseobacterium soldanellicola]|uniref:cAMP-binding domain of CRP or a regulatory subunit of cAMP-dependent protein kinases n=1 Tax=Chryseobacterium soldanellicola TaxID=311333 RepID=A0A1H1GIT0_9FLAO|nr:Crp/Fnr family transcriptional regulator [Chryseobacterium soldanellicola]SDR13144.1 cAMP-binding domain of CRP or a regulatory subunit of cAMP-dependent protein kinases [Chryseobacterium soldanellicola]
MVIAEDILLSLDAEVQSYKINDIIFNEGDQPKYYYQIISGTVKLNNYFEDGKEIIHSVPFDGHCFAETFLISDKKYPINAIAMNDCEIIKLEKSKFIHLIKTDPDLLLKLYEYTAERMYYRYIMFNAISITQPLEKIRKVLDSFKTYNKYTLPYSYQVPFTRQQLAALAGLSVETVIRTVKKMEKEKTVKIENGKIFY